MSRKPYLPPSYFRRTKPIREKLRATLDAIHADEWNRDLWREADELNRRLLEIEREFFAERRAA